MTSSSSGSREEWAAAANPWRPALHRMRGEPLPIYLFEQATLPAASLWVGARRCLRRLPVGAPIFVRQCGPVFLQRAVAALFSGRPLVVAGPAPLGALDRAALRRARVWVARPDGSAGGAVAPVEVDDLAAVVAAPPDHVRLPAEGWHQRDVLRRVLRSLVTPSHVLCGERARLGGST